MNYGDYPVPSVRRLLLTAIAAALVTLAGGMQVFGQSGDPLTDAVNFVRVANGVQTLAYDAHLARWAAVNNEHGFGHAVLGPASFQCAAWGSTTCAGVVQQWLSSAAHATIILHPGITHCGGAYSNGVWTLNVGYGGTAGPGVNRGDSRAGPAGSTLTVGGAPPSACVVMRRRRGFHPFRRFVRCH